MNWQSRRKSQGDRGRILPRQSWRSRSLRGLIAALLTLGLVVLGVWQPLERMAYQGLFQLRGAVPWDERVVVVGIDNASLRQFGKFPWARTQYTQLIERLTPAEPSVIVLDILMPESSPDDQALAEAMQLQGRVVLARALDDLNQPLPPNPVLAEAAIAQGHVLNYKDSDGLTRRIIPIVKKMPALGIATARVYSLTTAPLNLPPLDRPLLINWLAPVREAQHYSFADVVRGEVPPQAFKDKIVLVGMTATGLDSLQTPFDQNPPASGVHLHATAIANILQQNFLHSGYGTLESGQNRGSQFVFVLVLLSGLLSSWLMIPGRPIHQLVVVVGLCGIWGSLCGLLFQVNYLLPVVLPMLVFILTGVVVAIEERLRVNSRLRESEERYNVAIQGANDGVWDWNLKTNQVYFSPRWLALIGDRESDLDGSPEDWFKRVHPDDRDRVKEEIAAHLNGESPDLISTYRLRHRDGSDRWMFCRGVAVRDLTGQAYRMAGSQTDITAIKEAEEQLQHQAFYDGLTGLPNRRLFTRRLETAIQKYRVRSHSPTPNPQFAVLFLDLDRFKVVNDSLGHSLGDRLLVAIARRLQTVLTSADTLARFGGDEFTLLLETVPTSAEAEAVAERIHTCLTSPFYLDGHEVFTTVSIGIAMAQGTAIQSPSPAVDFLRNANIAMYQAKALGKARYAIFKPPLHRKAITLLQLETDLRRTISQLPISGTSIPKTDDSDFLVYYQPIVSLSTGRITGFEALVRWQHPKQGLVLPNTFIPLAEETDLIASLDLWVLRQACQQIQTWQQQFSMPLTVSVNISGIQLKQPTAIAQIEQIALTQLARRSLKLEITESHFMEETTSAISSLRKLRALGIGLSIDDFGTGYSSLGRLHQLPVDTLKIDRSFVKQIKGDRRPHNKAERESQEIIQTIVQLAHTFGMDVVAEGVETVTQLTQLRRLQCDYGQGYFFSKPQDHRAIEALMRSEPKW